MSTLTLYQNLSDKRVLNKNLVTIGDVNCTITSPSDVLQPTFYIEGNYTNCNYCYFADTGRYYFINSIVALDGGRVVLNCTVDVLMSYKNSIKNLNCIVARSESDKTDYIVDSSLPVSVKRQLYTSSFGDTIIGSGNTYILGVI